MHTQKLHVCGIIKGREVIQTTMQSLNEFLSSFEYPSKEILKRNFIPNGNRGMIKTTPELQNVISLESMGKPRVTVVIKKEKEDEKKKTLVEIIRPELNIEKHADFIFIPAHSKKVKQSRRREGRVTLPDGSNEKSYLDIHPGINGKTPTTTTRKIYLALQRLYEEKKREGKLHPDGSWVVSSCEIVRLAMLTLSGKNIQLVHNEIRTLRSCMFEWANVFIGPDGEKYELLSTANILDKYEHVSKKKRKTPEEQFRAAHLIRFGEHIRNNLDANKTKPVNYTTVLGIHGELALVLYTRLDIILADKEHYSRTSKGIFEDLNLADEGEYKYPSGRKRKLEKAIKELNGKLISTGILRLKLQKTVGGTDWKLEAHKTSFLPVQRKSRSIAPVNAPEIITLLGRDIGDAVGSYKEKRRLYEMFAVFYPADLVHQAISEYKAEGQHAKYPVRFFTAIMHRISHQRGRD